MNDLHIHQFLHFYSFKTVCFSSMYWLFSRSQTAEGNEKSFIHYPSLHPHWQGGSISSDPTSSPEAFCIHANADLLNVCNQPPRFFLTAYFTFNGRARQEMDQRWQRHNGKMRENEQKKRRLSKSRLNSTVQDIAVTSYYTIKATACYLFIFFCTSF